MKVVCIDDTAVNNFTTGGIAKDFVTCGKIYQVLNRGSIHDNDVYYIIGNDGTEVALRTGRFKLLDEYRIEKIEEILK
jgi:hypothetical protein